MTVSLYECFLLEEHSFSFEESVHDVYLLKIFKFVKRSNNNNNGPNAVFGSVTPLKVINGSRDNSSIQNPYLYLFIII